MPTIHQEEFQKSLKHIYDDLLEAEKNQIKDPSGFRNRLQVIHETLQDQEMRICTYFCLGDFRVLPKFESEYLRRGDSGMDQIIKSQIKLLAVEIGLDLETINSVVKTNERDIEKQTKCKWTRGEKIGLVGIIVAIVSIVIGFLVKV